MIKKLLFVYFCLFGFSFQGFGQIKLTLDDLPEIGTKKIISYGQAPETAKAGEASATAQTWDFTALAPTSQEAIEFKNPIETPFYDEFPLSDMARSGPLTSLLGFSLPNFGQGDGAVGTAYYGINNATKSIFTIGLVTDINIGGFVDLEDVKIEGTPPDLYLTALEYGKSASSNAKFPFTIEVPGIPIPITVSLNIEREMTADAFGTIYLPTDTFEVLRIHDKSILKPKIDLLPDTIGSVETHRYIFIAKDEDYPVMTLTMSGSGADATIVNVEYVDLPAEPAVVDFDYSADCLSVDFINESSNAFNFSWDFGDGTTSLDYQPDYTYKNKGDYEVTLTATDLNGDTIKITKSISVNCVVDPDFNISDVNCLTISFNNQTNNGATYLWEFGDGGTSTDEDPTHTYNKPGDFTVTLTAYGVAGDTAVYEQDITVLCPANADFDSQITCLSVDFEDQSENAASFNWQFGDGNSSTEKSPTHNYELPGTYTVKLSIVGTVGDTDSETNSVTVDYCEGIDQTNNAPNIIMMHQNNQVQIGTPKHFSGWITLTDLSGKTLATSPLQQGSATLPTQKLIAGLYVIQVQNQSGQTIWRQKIVLQP